MENHVKKSLGKIAGSILECAQNGKILTINFSRDYNISICGKRGMFRNRSLKKENLPKHILLKLHKGEKG
jgi:hypothetical protein